MDFYLESQIVIRKELLKIAKEKLAMFPDNDTLKQVVEYRKQKLKELTNEI